MNKQQYKEYLNIEKFETYITIPQVYALSKSRFIYRDIGKQIQKSDAEIFLLGIGHAQNILLPKLQTYSKRPLICVGIGLDAISGCVNIIDHILEIGSIIDLKIQKFMKQLMM